MFINTAITMHPSIKIRSVYYQFSKTFGYRPNKCHFNQYYDFKHTVSTGERYQSNPAITSPYNGHLDKNRDISELIDIIHQIDLT
ncbi:hypothetical protein STEG23_018189, partial [Scotinomys teguina]